MPHLVVHCWADLESVHGFLCYDNIAPNAKRQRVLVFGLCLVQRVFKLFSSSPAIANFVLCIYFQWALYIQYNRGPNCSVGLDYT